MTDEPQVRQGRIVAVLRRVEGTALVVAFLLSMILPLTDAIGRPLGGFYLYGSATYRSQLTLWLAFLGGLLATREGRHLTLSTAEVIGHARIRNAARLFSSSVAAAVCAVLAYSAAGVVAADRREGTMLAIGRPVQASSCVTPVALLLIALRLASGASVPLSEPAVPAGA